MKKHVPCREIIQKRVLSVLEDIHILLHLKWKILDESVLSKDA